MHLYPTKLQQSLPPGTAPPVNPKTVYIVGGSVRDLLLGRSPLDYDLAVAVDPKRFARQLASHTKGRLVELGKPGQMIYRVVTSSNVFDVSGLAGPTIEADLSQRDFTINAMAADAATGDIIDVFNGREDLLSGRVHMVSEAVFRQDPVRLVRAFRMAAVYNFHLSAQTAAAVQTHAALIARSAGERVWSELLKTLEARRSVCSVRQMAACGLLQTILPEINTNCPQAPSGRHAGAVTDTIKAYSALEQAPDRSFVNYSRYVVPERSVSNRHPGRLVEICAPFARFHKIAARHPHDTLVCASRTGAPDLPPAENVQPPGT